MHTVHPAPLYSLLPRQPGALCGIPHTFLQPAFLPGKYFLHIDPALYLRSQAYAPPPVIQEKALIYQLHIHPRPDYKQSLLRIPVPPKPHFHTGPWDMPHFCLPIIAAAFRHT